MATEEEYDHIYAFLSNHEYPAGFGKNEKRALRRKVHNYKVNHGVLFYLLKENWRQVPHTNKDEQRILEACHALPEGRPGKWESGCPV